MFILNLMPGACFIKAVTVTCLLLCCIMISFQTVVGDHSTAKIIATACNELAVLLPLKLLLQSHRNFRHQAKNNNKVNSVPFSEWKSIYLSFCDETAINCDEIGKIMNLSVHINCLQSECSQNLTEFKGKIRNSSIHGNVVAAGQQFSCKMTKLLSNLALI